MDNNAWNFSTVSKKKKKKNSSGSFKNVINKMCLQIIYIQYIFIVTRKYDTLIHSPGCGEGKKKREKILVSEHTIKVYSNLYCGIHADVNKRQITVGKNSPDKIEERRSGIIPQMINLRFGIRALPLNPKVWRKADRIYRWWTVFSPSAI